MTLTSGNAPATTPVSLYPQVEFSEDPALGDLPKLFDPEWVWDAYCQQFGRPETDPDRFRIRQFSHNLGRLAIVSYEVEWAADEYIPSQLFSVMMQRGKPDEVFRYPEDRQLPGLSEVADPESARRPINRHVLAMPARRVRVELVRYRPANRAVLRHSINRVRFYARVMRPHTVAPTLKAHELMGQSAFVVPRLAGYWAGGGVVWMSEIPGKNLRQYIRQGRMPDTTALLDGLETLWNGSQRAEDSNPFNLSRVYQWARRSIKHNVHDSDTALRSFKDATKALDPFVKSWAPSGNAHNDFYDDQMLVLRDGRIAVVDYEEAGPGDPMLDVANFLAHLRGREYLGSGSKADASGAYYPVFRGAALDRFGWNEREFALREAVCIFRNCTNTFRHPQPDWRDRLEAGLSVVNETLG